jgi:hypothetical protein
MVLSLLTAGLAAAGVRDSHSPRLRPVASDVQRARTLLLTKIDLPSGFHIPNGQLPGFTGDCGNLDDPNLSGLIETANVSNPVLESVDSGLQFLPTAAVFASPAQAAKAQALETGPDAVKCAISIIKTRLMLIRGARVTVTGETQHTIARTDDGVIVRARQAILAVKVSPNFPFQMEVSFVFLRHGRALSEIRTFNSWFSATSRRATLRPWNDAIDAAARRLGRSGF